MAEDTETQGLLTESFVGTFNSSQSPTPSDSSSRLHSPEFGSRTGSSALDISLAVLPTEPRGSLSWFQRRNSAYSLPAERDTSLETSGYQGDSFQRRQRQSVGRGDAESLAGSVFDFLSFTDVDVGQRQELDTILAKETGWRRVCCHKGLVANIFFLLVMVAGIILGEVLFPLEGIRGSGRAIFNDTACLNNLEGCVGVRVLRAIGLFGFIGGVTNWVAIEMLFIRVPYLIGTGVIAKQYREIRDSICRIVVDTLFDPTAVSDYFSGQRKHTIEMLHLGHHFGGLLDTAAANTIVEKKIDSVLAGPEGLILALMGIDHSELKSILRKNVLLFLAEVSPVILDKLSPGIITGEGLQEEVEQILEQKIEELSATKVKQIITLIIRKHLSWLILWGNISGAVIGLLSELLTLLIAYLIGDITN